MKPVYKVMLWCLFFVFSMSTISLPLAIAEQKNQLRDPWPKEHYVLVHGGWHGAWCWYKVELTLKAMGNSVTVIDLPAHGKDKTDPKKVTLQGYIDCVTKALDAIDEPVILVGHGTSGVIVSMAAEARPDKIKNLIYIAGTLANNGETIADVLTLDQDSLVVPNTEVNFKDGTIAINAKVIDQALYAMSPSYDRSLARREMRPEPIAPLYTPVALTEHNFGKITKYYIRTIQDQAVTANYQSQMIQKFNFNAVYDIDSDHAAFFSKALYLSAMLLTIPQVDSLGLDVNESINQFNTIQKKLEYTY